MEELPKTARKERWLFPKLYSSCPCSHFPRDTNLEPGIVLLVLNSPAVNEEAKIPASQELCRWRRQRKQGAGNIAEDCGVWPTAQHRLHAREVCLPVLASCSHAEMWSLYCWIFLPLFFFFKEGLEIWMF